MRPSIIEDTKLLLARDRSDDIGVDDNGLTLDDPENTSRVFAYVKFVYDDDKDATNSVVAENAELLKEELANENSTVYTRPQDFHYLWMSSPGYPAQVTLHGVGFAKVIGGLPIIEWIVIGTVGIFCMCRIMM